MIYFIQAEGIGHIKIGFTADADAAIRLAQLQTGSSVPLRLLGTIPGELEDEKNLHRRFAASGVGGEWFMPVPELLAAIPPSNSPRCGAVEVAERTVSIRVLTVGRKQFSKALLEQLPLGDAIDWYSLVGELWSQWTASKPGTGTRASDRRQTARTSIAAFARGASLAPYVRGEVWGWVKGGFLPRDQADDGDPHGGFRWIIFSDGGTLFRSRDFASPAVRSGLWIGEHKMISAYGPFFDPAAALSEDVDISLNMVRELWRMRTELVGWRDRDQLFIGV